MQVADDPFGVAQFRVPAEVEGGRGLQRVEPGGMCRAGRVLDEGQVVRGVAEQFRPAGWAVAWDDGPPRPARPPTRLPVNCGSAPWPGGTSPEEYGSSPSNRVSAASGSAPRADASPIHAATSLRRTGIRRPPF